MNQQNKQDAGIPYYTQQQAHALQILCGKQAVKIGKLQRELARLKGKG